MLYKLPSLSTTDQHAAVCAHLAEYGSPLRNAARLLGGDAGEARVLRIMSDLHETIRLERTTRSRLVDLHRLLTLDPYGDPETGLTSCPALDPGSRVVEDICLLADRLFDLLIEVGRLDDDMNAAALALEDRDAA